MKSTNQKSLSVDAKLLYNLTGQDVHDAFTNDDDDDWHKDHLIVSVPVYVCYNYRSWSLGAGFHLGIGNEDPGNTAANDDSDIKMGEDKGYDNLLSVPVLKIGYNLYDKVNFEYNYDLSGNNQGSIGVGYYWNF